MVSPSSAPESHRYGPDHQALDQPRQPCQCQECTFRTLKCERPGLFAITRRMPGAMVATWPYSNLIADGKISQPCTASNCVVSSNIGGGLRKCNGSTSAATDAAIRPTLVRRTVWTALAQGTDQRLLISQIYVPPQRLPPRSAHRRSSACAGDPGSSCCTLRNTVPYFCSVRLASRY